MRHLAKIGWAALAMIAAPLAAQDLSAFKTGPVFEDFGPHAPVETDFAIPEGMDLFIALGTLAMNKATFAEPDIFFSKKLFEIFGYFLDILIALEIMENVTAYLKRHVVQVELVIVTSLTAIARKIIIFDFGIGRGHGSGEVRKKITLGFL